MRLPYCPRHILRHGAAFLVLMCLPCVAQVALEVTTLDGAARIQRSQKRTWEDLEPGKKVGDNDLVETFFQSRLTLQFGPGNVVIMGSNSRLLANISELRSDGRRGAALNATLFAGGVFVKASSGVQMTVYTANAVAQLDSGALSTVVEEKTGETGFQALEGAIAVRNITQQSPATLRAGQTTLVFPGREPTPALYITTRHVAVLKHFFGDEYIAHQLTRSGITPTEEKSTDRPRRSFTENLVEKQYAKQKADDAVYKPPISKNKVYASVVSIQQEEAPGAPRIDPPRRASASMVEIGSGASVAIAEGNVYPLVFLRPSLFFPLGGVGLNAFAARDYQGFGLPQFSSSVDGLLSLVHFADIDVPLGEGGRVSAHLGSLDALTMGNGLVVDRMTSVNPYALVTPPGLTLSAAWEWIDLGAFVADLSGVNQGGGHLRVTLPFGVVGAGYYLDRNPAYSLAEVSGARFAAPPPGPASTPDSMVHIYEVNAGFDIAQYYNASVMLWAEFAQKLDEEGNDGFVVRAPLLEISFRRFALRAGLLLESGALTAGTFAAVHPAAAGWTDSLGLRRQPAWLTPDRRAWGAVLSLQARPLRGTFVDIGARYDFLADNTVHYRAQDAAGAQAFLARVNGLLDTLTALTYDLHAGISVNDSLWRWIKFARVYGGQVHGRYFPEGGASAGLWGVCAGLDVLTAPLVLNIAIEAGMRLYALDLAPGRAVALDSKNLIPEIYAGLRWGVR